MAEVISGSKADKAVDAQKGKEGWKRIVLDENDNIPPTGQFFGDNGVGYILVPGREALVPPGIVEILNNAVMSTPVVDPNTLQVVDYRQKRMYPYTLLPD
jgi:hypothetical protein